MQEHMAVKHQEGKMCCPLCTKVFAFKASLTNHLKQSHSKHCCNYCWDKESTIETTDYGTAQGLMEHKQAVHANVMERYKKRNHKRSKKKRRMIIVP